MPARTPAAYAIGMSMLRRLFPIHLDNEGYRGRAPALWLFALLLLLKAIMGVNGAINTRSVATGAGRILTA